MAKSKTKESKAKPAAPVTSVKNGGVTKPSQTPKAKAKEIAKSAAQKVVKEKDLPKKKKKVVEPESSDESSEEEEEDSDASESESDSDDAESSSESESSEDEAEKNAVKKPSTNGKSKTAKAESDSESDSASESESDSDEEEEAAAKPKANGTKVNGSAKAAAAESSDSSDSSDSDEESEDAKPAVAKPVNGKAKPSAKTSDSEEDSDDSEDDSEEDSEDSEDSEDDSEDEASDESKAEATEAPSKKRKADDQIDATPKKAKTDGNGQAATTLFAGSLSWNVDDNALYEAFKDFENLVGARVVTDKMSGRSRGFGYVDFSDAESATKAYEAMQGQELDGRALNLDYANARTVDSTPQARAADRAKKHGDNVSPESETLFVGNLPFDVDQDAVREFFGEVCEVASVRLPTDPETGNLKGFGYVTFNTVDDAKTVFQEKNGAPIGTGRMSRAVRLDFASSRPPRDSFGGNGGGFGGGRGGGRGGRGGGGRGGGGRGRGGGRGGFNSGSRGGSNFSGTKISFD